MLRIVGPTESQEVEKECLVLPPPEGPIYRTAGAGGVGGDSAAQGLSPVVPFFSWREAWEERQRRADVRSRVHAADQDARRPSPREGG